MTIGQLLRQIEARTGLNIDLGDNNPNRAEEILQTEIIPIKDGDVKVGDFEETSIKYVSTQTGEIHDEPGNPEDPNYYYRMEILALEIA